MTTAETLALVAESWLRLAAKAGLPPPSDEVRAALVELAAAAPATAARCPALTRLAAQAIVKSAQVSTASASKFDGNANKQTDSTLTAKAAAELIGISPQAVRLAAAQGRLTASRHPVTGGWRIDRAAAEAYRPRVEGQ